MGITVISSASANSSLPALAGLPGTESLPIDFAALLSGQLSAALSAPLTAGDSQEIPADDAMALTPEQLAELAALNPAHAAQIMPPQTATAAGPLVAVDRDNEALLVTSGRGGRAIAPANVLAGESGQMPLQPSEHSPLSGADGLPNFTASLATATNNGSGMANATEKPALDLASPFETAKIAATDQAPPAAGEQGAGVMPAAMATAGGSAPVRENTQVATPLHDRRWAQDFGEKIVWLAKNEQQTAQISINPPQLGPMQISLSLNGDQASAVFASPHAEVRQVIEDALPRLREMLSSAGISLGEANVGAHLPQQNREQAMQFANGTRFTNENAILGGEIRASGNSGLQPVQRGRGLVDLFA